MEYGSVLPCVAASALLNFIPILLAMILKLDIRGFSGPATTLEFQPPWLDALGAASVAAAILILALMRGLWRRKT
jgi:hypothetical protein